MRRPHHAFLPWIILLAGGALLAQAPTYTTEDAFQNLPPPSRGKGGPAIPKLAFRLDAEIPLPGPLPAGGPRLRDGLIEIDVAGGIAVTAATPGATARVVGRPPRDRPPEQAEWVESGTGRFRYRALPEGRIEAQRRCRRCKTGWRRCWRLRVAGHTPAPPLVADKRVCFGALDNRVYCVKARTGHRLWVTDVGARVSLPLVRWDGEVALAHGERSGPAPRLRLVLAVPDVGNRMVALDAATGVQAAAVRLPDGEGTLVSGPLVTPDGRIVVARQRYAASDASLMIYSLLELPPHDAGETGPPSPPVEPAASGLSP